MAVGCKGHWNIKKSQEECTPTILITLKPPENITTAILVLCPSLELNWQVSKLSLLSMILWNHNLTAFSCLQMETRWKLSSSVRSIDLFGWVEWTLFSKTYLPPYKSLEGIWGPSEARSRTQMVRLIDHGPSPLIQDRPKFLLHNYTGMIYLKIERITLGLCYLWHRGKYWLYLGN